MTEHLRIWAIIAASLLLASQVLAEPYSCQMYREAARKCAANTIGKCYVEAEMERLGEQLCRTPEQFKAWSQNLAHENVLTTFSSYGEVSGSRQAELIRALALPRREEASALDQIAAVLRSTGRGPDLPV